MVLEARIQNQYHQAKTKASAGLCSLQRLCMRICPLPFQLLVATGLPWLVVTVFQSSRPASSVLLFSLHITLNFVCSQMSFCLLLGRMLVMVLRMPLDNSGTCPHLKILNLITPERHLAPMSGNIHRFQG